jgi:hypothetical protein
MQVTDKIEAFSNYDEKLLHIISDDVLAKIKDGDKAWENDVPEEVMKAIKFYQLFSYRAEKFEKIKI